MSFYENLNKPYFIKKGSIKDKYSIYPTKTHNLLIAKIITEKVVVKTEHVQHSFLKNYMDKDY
jgi:hypothetical protein